MVWWGPENGKRVAKSLHTLLDQVDALAPRRKKGDDGTIGDARHAARKSDHNPDAEGIVRALDITHDPTNGCDAGKIAEALRLSQDARIKYVIWSRRIVFSAGKQPWKWQSYTGSDPHTGHTHVSVVANDAKADDTRPWSISGVAQPAPAPPPAPSAGFRHTEIEATVWNDSIGAYGPIDITGHGASLPYRFPGARSHVTLFANGHSITVPILDDGPWNTTDYDYVLGTARPRAEEQFDNKEHADDGRVPTNKAGIDLLPATARYLGIDGKGLIDWQFAGAQQAPPPPAPPTQPAQFDPDTFLKDLLARLDARAAPIEARVTKLEQAMSDKAAPAPPVLTPTAPDKPAPSDPVTRAGLREALVEVLGDAQVQAALQAAAKKAAPVILPKIARLVFSALGATQGGIFGAAATVLINAFAPVLTPDMQTALFTGFGSLAASGVGVLLNRIANKKDPQQ